MTTAVIFVAGPVPDLDVLGRRVPPGPSAAPPNAAASNDVVTVTGTAESILRPVGPTTLGDRLRRRIAVRGPEFTVAADGGLDLALRLGHTPEFVVGDMDSVSDDAIGRARDSGSSLTVAPRAKDVSDFELALDRAVDLGASHLVVVGGAGGRLDHVLATILTLTSPKYSGLVLEALLVDNHVSVINGRTADATPPGDLPDPRRRRPSTAVTTGVPGDPVSLFSFNGPAIGVRTSGLAWQLDGQTLDGGTSLGVSNELVDDEASIALDGGCLAVVRTASYEEMGADLAVQDVGSSESVGTVLIPEVTR